MKFFRFQMDDENHSLVNVSQQEIQTAQDLGFM